MTIATNDLSNLEMTVRKDFPDYGVSAMQLHFGGIEQPYQAIFRRGQLVSIFTNSYEILPNEDALKISKEATAKAGLIPAGEAPTELYYNTPPSVLWNQEKTAMTALYVNPKPINVADPMQGTDNFYTGIAIRNSINGWSAFSGSVFAFRKICSNMSMHFASAKSLEVREDIEIGDASRQVLADSGRRAVTVESFRLTHSKGNMNVEKLQDAISEILESGSSIIERFFEMKKEKIEREQVMKIVKLPKTVLKSLNWLHIEKEGLKEKITFDETSVYKAFNDITDIATHTLNLGFETKMHIQQQVDAILVQKPRGRKV